MEGVIIETWKYAIIAGIVVLNFVFTLLLIANNSPIKGKQAKLGAASIVLVASLLGLISIFVMKDISPATEVSNAANKEEVNKAIAEGLKVVAKNKCTSCHIVNGDGTALGPDFDLIAQNSDLVTVEEFLSNPKLARPGTAMQNVNLDEEEVQKIIAMFIEMRGGTGSENTGEPASSDIGLTVFKSKCSSCHSFNGEGGNFGPDLTDVKSRRDEAGITAFIKDPTGGMPKVELSEEELKGVVAMLSGTSAPSGDTATTTGKGIEIIKGKCQGCHTYQGAGGSMGPDLTDVKSRRDAANLSEFIKNPTGGMPPLGLSDEDLKAVVDELMGTAGGADSSNGSKEDKTAGGTESTGGSEKVTTPVAGDHSVAIKLLKEKCSSCHTVNGEGGKFGPELTDVAKRKDKKQIVDFIMNPSGGMPNMGMPVDEATKIAEYFFALANGQSASSTPVKPSSPGIKLYEQHACNACHAIGGKGGTFGPELTQVGLRRDQDSLAKFLANPPSKMTITPLTKEEIDSLAGYLSTLK